MQLSYEDFCSIAKDRQKVALVSSWMQTKLNSWVLSKKGPFLPWMINFWNKMTNSHTSEAISHQQGVWIGLVGFYGIATIVVIQCQILFIHIYWIYRVWFSWVLWHINHCRLFNAKSDLNCYAAMCPAGLQGAIRSHQVHQLKQGTHLGCGLPTLFNITDNTNSLAGPHFDATRWVIGELLKFNTTNWLAFPFKYKAFNKCNTSTTKKDSELPFWANKVKITVFFYRIKEGNKKEQFR